MGTPNHFVFFLRHYNDIDHMAPVIWKLNQANKDYQIDVCLMEDYQFKHITEYTFVDDYRIKEIKQLSNCNVRFLHDLIIDTDKASQQSIKKESTITYIKKWGRKLPTDWPKQVWDTLVNISTGKDRNWEKIAEEVYEKLLADNSRSVVSFDWIMFPGNRGDFVNQFVEMANKDGHVTVSLPHGDAPFINYWSTTDDFTNHGDFGTSSIGIKGIVCDSEPQIRYNHIVVPNNLIKSRWDHHNKKRFHTLGSPRFNPQWVEKLAQISPNFEWKNRHDKKRVVVFSRGNKHTLDQTALAEAIRIIAQFPNLSVVVKHHTRSINDELQTEYHSQTGRHIGKKENVQIVSDDVHSVSLFEWGDVFIDAGTSVIFEAVTRNKPVLALEYAHWNESTIAHYLPRSASLRSRDDLYGYMHKINNLDKIDSRAATYNADERDKFLNEVVTLGNDDVLREYVEFLTNL